MNQSRMAKLIALQSRKIKNLEGQIDALKGVPAGSQDADYQNGYSYQYAIGEQQSAQCETIL